RLVQLAELGGDLVEIGRPDAGDARGDATAGGEDWRSATGPGHDAGFERAVDRFADDEELARVRIAQRIEHDEQGKEERNHVGVAHEPSFVILRDFRCGLPAAHAASRRGASFFWRSPGLRKPSSFSRTMRGLSPDWMDISPSMTTS